MIVGMARDAVHANTLIEKLRSELARLTLPVLVIGQEGDDVHPASVAREIAAELPNAQLEVFSEGSALWDDRKALRRLLAGFLNDQ